MYRLFLCLRYFLKRRMALFAIAAVTLCVGLLIVITSLFHGFAKSYVGYTEQLFGQIAFYPFAPLTNKEYSGLASYYEQLPQVKRVLPIVRTGALLYLGKGNVRAVEVVGIDLARQSQEPAFREGLFLARADMDTFGLEPGEKERIEAWLTEKLRRPLRPEDWPVGAIVGVGLLGEPDEKTDAYDRAAIREQLAGWNQGFTITTGYMGKDEDDAKKVEKRGGVCWPINVVQTGLSEADRNFIYLPFAYVAELAGNKQKDGRVTCHAEVQVQLAETADVRTTLKLLQSKWRDYAAKHLHWPSVWTDNSVLMVTSESHEVRQFTAAIKQQLAILQLILSLICLVVVTLVFVILLMIVYEKRRDIGILRSLGASRRGVALIFVGYGGAIGAVGAAAGMALGVLATHYIAALESGLSRCLGFKIWRSGVYMFQTIPNEVAWPSVWGIMLVGVVSAILGAFLPALRAARMPPVRALRYE